jgi:hypothetical protein
VCVRVCVRVCVCAICATYENPTAYVRAAGCWHCSPTMLIYCSSASPLLLVPSGVTTNGAWHDCNSELNGWHYSRFNTNINISHRLMARTGATNTIPPQAIASHCVCSHTAPGTWTIAAPDPLECQLPLPTVLEEQQIEAHIFSTIMVATIALSVPWLINHHQQQRMHEHSSHLPVCKIKHFDI